MLNKKHWLSDVLAGAGVGIFSTQAVYAIYPWIERNICESFPGIAANHLMVIPAYMQGTIGFSMVCSFDKPNFSKNKAGRTR